MLHTAHRVLSTGDARDYLLIVSMFFYRVKNAREMADVAIAAGIAEEELEKFSENLLGPEPGQAAIHHLKPV